MPYNAYQLTGVTYPDGETVSYDFNAAADATRLSGAQEYVSDVRYNALGKILAMDIGNGTATTYDYYGAAGNFRLKQMTVSGSAQGAPALMDRVYAYDKVGNITTITAEDARYNQSFDYDDLSRLTAHSSGLLEEDENFSYSPAGNLLTKNGNSYSYTEGTHQAVSDGVNSYSYDANGNMRTKNDTIFSYDADNRLLSLSSGERFEYDYSGRRVKKTEGGKETYYFNEYYEEEVAADTGLIASYPFSEGSGMTTVDTTGNGYDGTLRSGVAWTSSGKYGKALSFDGADGYVDLLNSQTLEFSPPYTIEAWVTFHALNQHHRFLNKGDTTSGMWSLYRDHNDGKIALQMCSNGQWHRALVGTTSPQAQQWYHVVVTSDGNIAKLYINGQEEASSSHAWDLGLPVNGKPIRLGCHEQWCGAANGNAHNGLLDEVRVVCQSLISRRHSHALWLRPPFSTRPAGRLFIH